MTAICHLHALSAHAPDTVLTNDHLTKLVDTNDEWIVTRTGIKQRRKLADTDNASDLGLVAARRALDEAGVAVDELTHIIAATCTPDMLSPSVACILAGKLGAGPVMAFDFSAACSGFLYGLSICRGMLAQSPDACILFVCTEALTRRVNWSDRATCVLFGDAATACVLTASADKALAGVEDVICQSDGNQRDLITVGGGTTCRYGLGQPVDENFFITMQGRETYKHAVRQMVRVCEQILARNSLSIDDVNLFVPHQANMRIIEAVGSRLNVDGNRVFTNVDKYGNTSSASIPLALDEARAAGRIKPGDRVLMTAFGSGLTWGAALLRF
ncbi:ketoacyl-ACP synthase III [Desulfovibrio sp. PG-178-WT-4]|uniref:Beta-ketoacyl-[acyl-carrier-protein] synthase III n=1 Tax=Desulfovibrio porci TaxID=2605782 RepID=A0A6L5XHT4_9BACT|nr:beta-ketoacyl-ACP synthase III [Desulfovibrio porci]MSS26687.1 ketoacyl-ACP synthase III [Desulfovibrio porci]